MRRLFTWHVPYAVFGSIGSTLDPKSKTLNLKPKPRGFIVGRLGSPPQKGPEPGAHYLYLADIEDKYRNRGTLTQIYRIKVWGFGSFQVDWADVLRDAEYRGFGIALNPKP